MNSSDTTELQAVAASVSFTASELVVRLVDERTITVPLTWYPRLLHGSASERACHELMGNGTGIHWPLLDEDISVRGLLLGRKSGESAESLRRWLAGRN